MLDKSEILLLYIRLSIFRSGLLKTAIFCNISTAQKGGVWLINQSTKLMENVVISLVCSHENMFSRLLKNSGGNILHFLWQITDRKRYFDCFRGSLSIRCYLLYGNTVII